MGEEEFQEADVLWPDGDSSGHGKAQLLKAQKPGRGKQPTKSSLRAERTSCSWTQGFTILEENCEFDERKKRKMIPPHVEVARRAADRAAFSMFAGNGRTLKGRDMRQVRDAVLRMTGFLER